MSPTPFLHVANGTTTTRVIAAAGIPGALSIWADPLHDGPVPGGISDDELMEVRARYLGDGAPASDPVNDLRRWRDVIAHYEVYDELVLWFEHDLFDQLNLIQLLAWIGDRLPPDRTVSLVSIDSFPGRPGFKGLGELTPDELAPLFDRRRPVDAAEYSLARAAWDAFRQPTPEALDALRAQNTDALPYLAAAIERFLEEYPWTRDGLSRSERRLLTLAREGPLDLVAVLPRMHDDEGAYYMTDSSLVELARELAGTSPPLLEWAGSTVTAALDGSIRTSEAGERVLIGEDDRVRTYGLNRWFGGVHLAPGTDRWRWDDTRKRITPARQNW